jgi:hypothetical protein
VNAGPFASEHIRGMKERGWLQQYDWLMIVWATGMTAIAAFTIYVAFFVP